MSHCGKMSVKERIWELGCLSLAEISIFCTLFFMKAEMHFYPEA